MKKLDTETTNSADAQIKAEIRELKRWIPSILAFLAFLGLCVGIVWLIGNQKNAERTFIGTMEEVGIGEHDGLAYIKYHDLTCQLLSDNGENIVFNEFVVGEHDLVAFEEVIENNTSIILIFDRETKMIYMGVEKTDGAVTNENDYIINSLYDKSLLE